MHFGLSIVFHFVLSVLIGLNSVYGLLTNFTLVDDLGIIVTLSHVVYFGLQKRAHCIQLCIVEASRDPTTAFNYA